MAETLDGITEERTLAERRSTELGIQIAEEAVEPVLPNRVRDDGIAIRQQAFSPEIALVIQLGLRCG